MTWPTNHLTSDDLDAFHSGALSSASRLHLETCETCRELAVTDAELLAALGQLEPAAPGDQFVDRVMARVTITEPARVPILSFPSVNRVRLVALIGMAAALVLSVAWSAVYRTQLEAWLAGTAGELASTGWLAVRALAATAADQPWFDAARSAWIAPVRLAAGLLLGLLVYGSGLLALRRLMTPSAGSVSNANA